MQRGPYLTLRQSSVVSESGERVRIHEGSEESGERTSSVVFRSFEFPQKETVFLGEGGGSHRAAPRSRADGGSQRSASKRHGLLLVAERKKGGGDPSAKSRIDGGCPILEVA